MNTEYNCVITNACGGYVISDYEAACGYRHAIRFRRWAVSYLRDGLRQRFRLGRQLKYRVHGPPLEQVRSQMAASLTTSYSPERGRRARRFSGSAHANGSSQRVPCAEDAASTATQKFRTGIRQPTPAGPYPRRAGSATGQHLWFGHPQRVRGLVDQRRWNLR